MVAAFRAASGAEPDASDLAFADPHDEAVARRSPRPSGRSAVRSGPSVTPPSRSRGVRWTCSVSSPRPPRSAAGAVVMPASRARSWTRGPRGSRSGSRPCAPPAEAGRRARPPRARVLARRSPCPGPPWRLGGSPRAEQPVDLGRGRSVSRVNHCRIGSSGMLIILPNWSSGGSADADVVAQALAHPPLAVGAHQDRHRHRHLRALPLRLLEVAGHHQAEQLLGAAQLDVGPDLDANPSPASAGRGTRAGRPASRPRAAW